MYKDTILFLPVKFTRRSGQREEGRVQDEEGRVQGQAGPLRASTRHHEAGDQGGRLQVGFQ